MFSGLDQWIHIFMVIAGTREARSVMQCWEVAAVRPVDDMEMQIF